MTSNQINEETIARARRRVAKMSETDLLDWAEVSIPGMHRHLDAYRQTKDTAHLMEMAFGEMQLNLVISELMDRCASPG